MKSATIVSYFALCLLLGLWSSCTKPPAENSSNPRSTASNAPTIAAPAAAKATPSTNQRIYLVKGVVKEVVPEKNKVKIAHETIPDYMEAMTMFFDVKDSRELAKVKAGDTVRFRMIVTGDDGWIDNLVKVDDAPKPEVNLTPETFRRAREVTPLVVGDPLPEYRFTNQLGQVVKTGDFKGQAVAITFFFTRCAFPTFCPRMSGNFAAAQQKLKAMTGGPTNWHLISITFDPEHDTPPVLASYARQYNQDPAHWSFVSGDLIDITAIGEQFGLMFWRSDPTKPAGIDHNLRTVVIDANGRLQKVLTENEWKVDDLVTEVVRAAGVPRS